MNQRVVVTGIGVVSALGSSVNDLWNGLLKCRSGITQLPRFVAAGLPATTGGEVESVALNVVNRDDVIASIAIDQAVTQAGVEPEKSGFIWSTGLDMFHADGTGLVQRSAGSCFARLSVRFGNPRRMIATACASGTQAIGEAFHLIRLGKIARCVAGGSSAMLTPFYVVGFAGIQALAIDDESVSPASACRPFDRSRRGFVISDGAGAVVLESLESARARGVAILGEVIGFGMSQDAFDLNRPLPDGHGAKLSMTRAIDDAGIAAEDVDAINAHGTGTILGDIAEAAAIRGVFATTWNTLPVSSAKGAIGHAQSAAGALEAIVAMKTCETGIVPPTVNLVEPDDECQLDHVMNEPRNTGANIVISTSFGMGGQNAALILKKYFGDE